VGLLKHKPYILKLIIIDSELMILQLSNSTKISSKCFPPQAYTLYKVAWTSPGGNISNQTGHDLIETRRETNVLDLRSYW